MQSTIAGKVGLYLFLLIAAESIWKPFGFAARFQRRRASFSSSELYGALFGSFSPYTVYSGTADPDSVSAGWLVAVADGHGTEVE